MNWGTKVIIGMSLFMAFIVAMGAVMIMSDQDDLIEKEYYEKGLDYDKEYNEQQNTIRDSIAPEIKITPDDLIILFPLDARYNLTCKRLSDASMDKIFTGNTGKSKIIKIERAELTTGLWILKLRYRINNKSYLIERKIIIP